MCEGGVGQTKELISALFILFFIRMAQSSWPGIFQYDMPIFPIWYAYFY